MLHFAVNIWNGSIQVVRRSQTARSWALLVQVLASIYRLDASRANDLIAFDKASNSAMSISAKKEKERERERECVCVCVCVCAKAHEVRTMEVRMSVVAFMFFPSRRKGSY